MVDSKKINKYLSDLEKVSKKHGLALSDNGVVEGCNAFEYILPTSATQRSPFVRSIVISTVKPETNHA
jgi:hypothetical protein